MPHNFPAIEALEAGDIDPAALARIAPGVDPERLLIRQARPWFERLALRGSAAIALPYVVYVQARVYNRPRSQLTRLIIHELIHVSQWRQEGYARFAFRYLGDYFRSRLGGQSHADSYRSIRYEVAARDLTKEVLAG
jgi:hypothetical protein